MIQKTYLQFQIRYIAIVFELTEISIHLYSGANKGPVVPYNIRLTYIEQ